MHPRLTELKTFIDAERRALLASAAALPVVRWTEKPAPERWSVSDVLWHLHKTESNIAGLIRKKVAEARAGGHPAETDTSSVLGALDPAKLTDRTKKIDAPTPIIPTEVVDADTVKQQLADSRAALDEALSSADGLALGTILHPHRIFGDLNLYQWIEFVGLHERRHSEQVDEAVSSLTS